MDQSKREDRKLSEVRGSCTACRGCLPGASPPARDPPSLVFVVAIRSASPAPRPCWWRRLWSWFLDSDQ